MRVGPPSSHVAALHQHSSEREQLCRRLLDGK
jgi:hypothetical protein